jgi:elongation factor G
MKIGVEVGKPRVSYREAIVGPAEKVRGQASRSRPVARGQFGDCVINLRALHAEEAEELELKFRDNIAFENKIVGGSIPKEFIPSVEAGVRQTALSGVSAGTR